MTLIARRPATCQMTCELEFDLKAGKDLIPLIDRAPAGCQMRLEFEGEFNGDPPPDDEREAITTLENESWTIDGRLIVAVSRQTGLGV